MSNGTSVSCRRHDTNCHLHRWRHLERQHSKLRRLTSANPHPIKLNRLNIFDNWLTLVILYKFLASCWAQVGAGSLCGRSMRTGACCLVGFVLCESIRPICTCFYSLCTLSSFVSSKRFDLIWQINSADTTWKIMQFTIVIFFIRTLYLWAKQATLL